VCGAVFAIMIAANDCSSQPCYDTIRCRSQKWRRRRWRQEQQRQTRTLSPRHLFFVSVSAWICIFSLSSIRGGAFIIPQKRHTSFCSHQFSYLCRDIHRQPQRQMKEFRRSTLDRMTLFVKPKKNSSTETKDSDTNVLLRNIGAFVPFFASQQQPKLAQPNKNDATNGGFWGSINGWFRRDTETKDDKISSKKIDPRKKNLNKEEKIKKNRDKIPVVPIETTSPFSKLQGWIPFNFTKSDVNKDNLKPISNDRKVTNNNPISVAQNFLSSFFKDTNEPIETWYTVFPKTRIMPGEMVPVTVAGVDLLVVASIDGRSLYCIANSCPHLGTPLETGKLTRLPIESKTIPSSKTTTLLQQPIPTTASSVDVAIVKSNNPIENDGIIFSETDISNILSQDGCEDCIVCPLHHTAFALKSGEVRGEWCPYPPMIGPIMGTIKSATSAAVFDVRTRGKNIEVRFNSILRE
jgi:nitrite reductase/ring-hydroxylating ferredoxin subunit